MLIGWKSVSKERNSKFHFSRSLCETRTRRKFKFSHRINYCFTFITLWISSANNRRPKWNRFFGNSRLLPIWARKVQHSQRDRVARCPFLCFAIHNFRKKNTKYENSRRQQWTNDSRSFHFTSTRLIVCLSRFAPTFNNKQLRPLAWNHIKYYNLSNIIGSYLQLDCRRASLLTTVDCLRATTNLNECLALVVDGLLSYVQFFEDFSTLENAEKKTTMRNSSVRILFVSSTRSSIASVHSHFRYLKIFSFPFVSQRRQSTVARRDYGNRESIATMKSTRRELYTKIQNHTQTIPPKCRHFMLGTSTRSNAAEGRTMTTNMPRQGEVQQCIVS